MKKIVENVKNGFLDKVAIHSIYCDRPEAEGLTLAKEYGILTKLIEPADKKYILPPAEEERLCQELKGEVSLICLAGFMRIFKHQMLSTFAGRIINIHPSILPKHTGLGVQQKAIDAGDRESGCTVHVVDEGIDTGSILAQSRVNIETEDTATSLSERILVKEHQLYSQVIKEISEGMRPLPLI